MLRRGTFQVQPCHSHFPGDVRTGIGAFALACPIPGRSGGAWW